MLSRRRFLQAALAMAAGAGGTPVWSEARNKGLECLNLAFMCWRIGDILDFDAQVQWVKEAGFESIAFHASPGHPGKWRGVDPAQADAGTIRKDFALSKGENSVHGSDSPASAAREISFFFSGLELVG